MSYDKDRIKFTTQNCTHIVALQSTIHYDPPEIRSVPKGCHIVLSAIADDNEIILYRITIVKHIPFSDALKKIHTDYCSDTPSVPCEPIIFRDGVTPKMLRQHQNEYNERLRVYEDRMKKKRKAKKDYTAALEAEQNQILEWRL